METAFATVKVSRPNLVTLASIGAIACIVADMVHEALGHGTASWLMGDRLLLLSTVGTQNISPNRAVSAAGTLANCLVGAISLLSLGRVLKFTTWTYFLWVFGAYNLMNVGYFVYSALLNSGDWARVNAGLSPPWLWRCTLGLGGATLYFLMIRWAASIIRNLVNLGEVAISDVQRLVLPAYLAGGAVMTIASVFNPFGPSLILLSGAGASFGLNAGMLFLPRMIDGTPQNQVPGTRSMPFSLFWFVLALVIAGVFIGVFGPGIRFSD
jgi:hypothetical protein